MADLMGRLATAVTRWAGSSWGFGIALTIVLTWAVSGPFLRFSNTWQLMINTTTTIGTFLMVFLIQRTQNKDGLAIQLKLNELVAAVEGANNHLIDIEDFSEQELEVLHRHYRRLAQMAREEGHVESSHSIAEAELRHHAKRRRREQRQTPPGDPRHRHE